MNTSILYEYNPWWINPDSIDYDRNIKSARMESPLKEYSFHDNNLLLIGPRQVGKTTYMKIIIRDLIKDKKVDPKQILYFSLLETLLKHTDQSRFRREKTGSIFSSMKLPLLTAGTARLRHFWTSAFSIKTIFVYLDPLQLH